MTRLFGFLGRNTKIDQQTLLLQQDKIYLEDNVTVGRQVTINATHKIESVYLDKEGVFIGKNSTVHSFSLLESVDVWIGAHSVILAGVEIGDSCIIGAGSIVTKSVPSYSVASGNPAIVKSRKNISDDNL